MIIYYFRDESTSRSTIIPYLNHYTITALSRRRQPRQLRQQRQVTVGRLRRAYTASHDHVGSPASNSPVSGSYFSDGQTDVGLSNVRDYIFHENSIICCDTVVVFCVFSHSPFYQFFFIRYFAIFLQYCWI